MKIDFTVIFVWGLLALILIILASKVGDAAGEQRIRTEICAEVIQNQLGFIPACEEIHEKYDPRYKSARSLTVTKE